MTIKFATILYQILLLLFIPSSAWLYKLRQKKKLVSILFLTILIAPATYLYIVETYYTGIIYSILAFSIAIYSQRLSIAYAQFWPIHLPILIILLFPFINIFFKLFDANNFGFLTVCLSIVIVCYLYSYQPKIGINTTNTPKPTLKSLISLILFSLSIIFLSTLAISPSRADYLMGINVNLINAYFVLVIILEIFSKKIFQYFICLQLSINKLWLKVFLSTLIFSIVGFLFVNDGKYIILLGLIGFIGSILFELFGLYLVIIFHTIIFFTCWYFWKIYI